MGHPSVASLKNARRFRVLACSGGAGYPGESHGRRTAWRCGIHGILYTCSNMYNFSRILCSCGTFFIIVRHVAALHQVKQFHTVSAANTENQPLHVQT